jgi:hypothetical protein
MYGRRESHFTEAGGFPAPQGPDLLLMVVEDSMQNFMERYEVWQGNWAARH